MISFYHSAANHGVDHTQFISHSEFENITRSLVMVQSTNIRRHFCLSRPFIFFYLFLLLSYFPRFSFFLCLWYLPSSSLPLMSLLHVYFILFLNPLSSLFRFIFLLHTCQSHFNSAWDLNLEPNIYQHDLTLKALVTGRRVLPKNWLPLMITASCNIAVYYLGSCTTFQKCLLLIRAILLM